jgi:murein DD-endopeptidase MepM/ murein hydrolase activator NlpD
VYSTSLKIDEYRAVLHSQKSPLKSVIIVLCNLMVFLKTKNMHPKRIFLIVLALFVINGGVVALFANQLTAITEAGSSVKDDSVVAPDVSTEESTLKDEQTATVLDDKPVITTYIVREGDTLSGIASKFNISVNTIRWANDLTTKTSKISIGDELTILPVTGVEYTVKKGDTLSGISAKFDVSQSDILDYNDIDADAVKIGMKIIVPNAEPIVPKAPTVKASPKVVTTEKLVVSSTSAPTSEKVLTDEDDIKEESTKFINPIPGGVITQGLHDRYAVDFGAPVGTNVHASASGTVLVAKSGGYSGGYGTYIVINHEDGIQTLYAHLSSISVSVGDKVEQGQIIAKSGNTGRSTGPHLHYEERGTGARNTFAIYKKGTQF